MFIRALGIALLLTTPALAGDVVPFPERYYQEGFCAGMDVKIRLGEQQRADCLTGTQAIEVEWHDYWKAAIGEALAHGTETGLTPGIILVCREDQALCLDASQSARNVLSHYHIRATLWDCWPVDATLADCRRWDL